MITINVKTLAVTISNRYSPGYVPMARNQFGDATPGYVRGGLPPNYPMPAIQTKVHWFCPSYSDPFAGLSIREDGWLVYQYSRDESTLPAGTVETWSLADYGTKTQRDKEEAELASLLFPD